MLLCLGGDKEPDSGRSVVSRPELIIMRWVLPDFSEVSSRMPLCPRLSPFPGDNPPPVTNLDVRALRPSTRFKVEQLWRGILVPELPTTTTGNGRSHCHNCITHSLTLTLAILTSLAPPWIFIPGAFFNKLLSNKSASENLFPKKNSLKNTYQNSTELDGWT